ncbi:MAG: hypothetical protein CL521_05030 [Actinobacteria bacterium]|nr:hypothetical protein [Actinomycetota bacterium]
MKQNLFLIKRSTRLFQGILILCLCSPITNTTAKEPLFKRQHQSQHTLMDTPIYGTITSHPNTFNMPHSQAKPPANQHSSSDEVIHEDIAPIQLEKAPLNYPNPFRINSGTTLYYHLNQNADINIDIYDMSGQRVYQAQFSSGESGGKSGINTFSFSKKSLPNSALSSAIYFYLISTKKTILGKGKMVSLP